MKKKVIYGSFVVLAIVAAIAYNVNIGLKSDGLLSDIALANVEALAQNEGGFGETLDCWATISSTGPNVQTHKTYCGSCEAKLCCSWTDSSTCKN